MTQKIIDKAHKLQNDINCYEKVIKYAATNCLIFLGSIGICDVSDDKELAKIIHDYCKRKQDELIKEFDSL